MTLNPSLIKEAKRKLFHFLSLLYAAGYYFMGREAVLKILVPILVVEGAIEATRLYVPRFNAWIMPLFGGIHREEEMRRVSGIFWTLLGSVITISVFKDPKVVLCALGYLVFADAAAALVGVPLGRHKLWGKSWEGSSACFAASFLVGLAFMDPFWAVAGAAIVTAVELSPLPWNDNFWVPLVSAVFLSLLKNAF